MRDILPTRWSSNPRQLPSACNPDAVADAASQHFPNLPTPEADGSPILTDEGTGEGAGEAAGDHDGGGDKGGGSGDRDGDGERDDGGGGAGAIADGLTPAQRLAIAALVSGRTFSSAAIQAGVSRRTLFAWRQLPRFQAVVDDLSREALEATAVRARNLMLKATRTLGEALGGDDRFAWAIRIANSKRVWEMGQMPKANDQDRDGNA